MTVYHSKQWIVFAGSNRVWTSPVQHLWFPTHAVSAVLNAVDKSSRRRTASPYVSIAIRSRAVSVLWFCLYVPCRTSWSPFWIRCWFNLTITTRSMIFDKWDWRQGWGQFRNWNWNWYQFQFQELELKRNWIKGIGIDKKELKELIQFLSLIVNSFWFFAMFFKILAELLD